MVKTPAERAKEYRRRQTEERGLKRICLYVPENREDDVKAAISAVLENTCDNFSID
jgi:hypothetical protein